MVTKLNHIEQKKKTLYPYFVYKIVQASGTNKKPDKYARFLNGYAIPKPDHSTSRQVRFLDDDCNHQGHKYQQRNGPKFFGLCFVRAL
jgi:hypothetical protein